MVYEYQGVCHLDPKGGGATLLVGEGVGGSKLGDWKESPALCILQYVPKMNKVIGVGNYHTQKLR
jgi:hypothetical protein